MYSALKACDPFPGKGFQEALLNQNRLAHVFQEPGVSSFATVFPHTLLLSCTDTLPFFTQCRGTLVRLCSMTIMRRQVRLEPTSCVYVLLLALVGTPPFGHVLLEKCFFYMMLLLFTLLRCASCFRERPCRRRRLSLTQPAAKASLLAFKMGNEFWQLLSVEICKRTSVFFLVYL